MFELFYCLTAFISTSRFIRQSISVGGISWYREKKKKTKTKISQAESVY